MIQQATEAYNTAVQQATEAYNQAAQAAEAACEALAGVYATALVAWNAAVHQATQTCDTTLAEAFAAWRQAEADAATQWQFVVNQALIAYTGRLAMLQSQADQAYTQYQAALAGTSCPSAPAEGFQFVAMEEPQRDPRSGMHLEHTQRGRLRERVEKELGHYPPPSASPGQQIPSLNTAQLKQQDWREAEKRVRSREQDSEWLEELDALLKRARYARPGDLVFSSGSLGRNRRLIEETYRRLFDLIERFENEVLVEYWMMNQGDNLPWESLRRPGDPLRLDRLSLPRR